MMLVFYVFYMFGNIATIGSPGIFIYGAFIFLTVYAYTELMDKNPKSWIWESIKSIAGIAILISTGDWFGLNTFIPFGSILIMTILILSPLVVIWFCRTEVLSIEAEKRLVRIS
jgi:hypothetical protein